MLNFKNLNIYSKQNSFISLLFVAFFINATCYAAADVLTILNWAEYMDPALIKKFEKHNKVKVKSTYYESDDARNSMMLANKGRGYDLIMFNGPSLSLYKKKGWLAPLTTKQVKNLKYIDKRWIQAFPKSKGLAIPHFWGTMGVAYRSDLVKSPITQWKHILEPEGSLKGKITMPRSARELVGLALKAKGYSLNSTNKSEIDEAYALLRKQKKFVRDFAYISLSEKSSLVTGDIIATVTYSGDALAVKEHNDKIVYVVPEEGSIIWIDYLGVSKFSKNKKLAYKFINFLNEAKNAAQLAQFVYYASPNKAAAKYLPKEFKQNSTIYPSKYIIDKSETTNDLPANIIRMYNSIYSLIIN